MRCLRPFADGFWSALAARALAGIGWAGTYMTGLKLLADKVDGPLLSRAAAGHAASIGISGALSFACADLLAHAAAGASHSSRRRSVRSVAWVLVALAIPGSAPPGAAPGVAALFDFRPVLRNRSAMAYAIAYCIHTFEMSALRGWGVAFLGFVGGDHRQRGDRTVADDDADAVRPARNAGERARQRSRHPVRAAAPDRARDDRLGARARC